MLDGGARSTADVEFAGVGVNCGVEGQNMCKPHTPGHAGSHSKRPPCWRPHRCSSPGQRARGSGSKHHANGRSIRGSKGHQVRLTIIPAGGRRLPCSGGEFCRGEVKLAWGDGLLLATGTRRRISRWLRCKQGRGAVVKNPRQIVILEFWATWCGPCQPKMAKLQTIQVSIPMEGATWYNRCQHRRKR